MEPDIFYKSASLLIPLIVLGILTVDLLPRVNDFLIKVVGVGVIALALAVFLDVWGFI